MHLVEVSTQFNFSEEKLESVFKENFIAYFWSFMSIFLYVPSTFHVEENVLKVYRESAKN